ncbi:hypothetical protein KI387_028319, partial [Taxus chinensis]
MVNVAGATEVTNTTFIAGIGPICETTGGKVEVGSIEPNGTDARVGTRAREMDTGMP